MLIVDQLMPIVDGITTVRLIKEQPDLKKIPVIIYSGNMNVEDTIEMMPIIDFYVSKTEPTVRLNTYVEQVFEKKKKERKSKEKKNKKKRQEKG